MSPPPLAVREQFRAERFGKVWTEQLNDVFADVAPYYDRANLFASFGQWNRILDNFMASVELNPGERALDVCAGTNAVGIALLKKEPLLEVHAIDRSAAMQEVGRQRAEAAGLRIESHIGDVHRLPFADQHFDVVTLQWATRHLRINEVFAEIRRVLKPGGRFFHCDMLRPANPVVELLYHGYLRGCLSVTGLLFRSSEAARECKRYFIDALELFYSAEELSELLRQAGFRSVTARSLLGGTMGFHRAVKP